jgi:hypothetical protein
MLRSISSSGVTRIQNKLDCHHYACQFKPFWQALGGTTERGAAFGSRRYAWLKSACAGVQSEGETLSYIKTFSLKAFSLYTSRFVHPKYETST